MDIRLKFWIDLAEYDAQTARAVLEAQNYPYVGFMCHQVAEKALKAVISKTDIVSPKIQKLTELAQQSGIYDDMNDAQKSLLDTLGVLSTAAECPESEASAVAMPTPQRCEAILSETEELLCWIKQRL